MPASTIWQSHLLISQCSLLEEEKNKKKKRQSENDVRVWQNTLDAQLCQVCSHPSAEENLEKKKKKKIRARDACCNWLCCWRARSVHRLHYRQAYMWHVTGVKNIKQKLDAITSRCICVNVWRAVLLVFVSAKCLCVYVHERHSYLLVWVTECMCASDREDP